MFEYDSEEEREKFEDEPIRTQEQVHKFVGKVKCDNNIIVFRFSHFKF